MAGVILELVSFRKLCLFAIIIAILQVVAFLLGGLIAPAPNSTEEILATKCLDFHPGKDVNRWFFPRPTNSNHSCKHMVEKMSDVPSTMHARQVVFMFQFPLPRDNMVLDMSRWFQNIIAIMMVDIKYEKKFHLKPEAEMTMDIRLGYRNRGDADDDWKELARSTEVRPLNCKLDHGEDLDGVNYDCEILPLFSLGSCHHDYYLVNVRLPVDDARHINNNIGMLQDLWLVEIHQNGGFTKVWFAMKTAVFPVTLLALAFFYKRVNELSRHVNLLERTILGLGVVMSVLNLPLEWLSLAVDVPYWLLVSDLRQGVFYAMLGCFWLIFVGEHMVDSPDKNRIMAYWKHLTLIGLVSSAMTIYDLSERGVQLSNPFYSVWSQPFPASLARASVIVAGVSAAFYFVFLTVMVAKVVFQLYKKRAILPSLPETRRKYYSGVIYRFYALLCYTFTCAGLTFAYFVVSQIDESNWKWGEEKLHYNSAFITGTYGMWNLYVISVLVLYAPSHKLRHPGLVDNDTDTGALQMNDRSDVTTRVISSAVVNGDSDVISTGETRGAGEGMAFLQKAAQD